jgi:hypothetical protein
MEAIAGPTMLICPTPASPKILSATNVVLRLTEPDPVTSITVCSAEDPETLKALAAGVSVLMRPATTDPEIDICSVPS